MLHVKDTGTDSYHLQESSSSSSSKNKKERYNNAADSFESLLLMSEVRRRIIETHENAWPDGVLKSEEMRACVAEAASTIHSDELDTSR